jgi:hypothetical protein
MTRDSVGRARTLNVRLYSSLTHLGRSAGARQTVAANGLAADTDREQTVDALADAFAEGRLTRDELDTRVGRALTARTYAELKAATSGLPGSASGPVRPSRPARSEVACQSPGVRTASLAHGSSLLFWGATWIIWALAAEVLHHRWPLNPVVFAVALACFLLIAVGSVRCAWRMMAGRLPHSEPAVSPRLPQVGRAEAP